MSNELKYKAVSVVEISWLHHVKLHVTHWMPMTADYIPIPIPIRIHYCLPIANAKSPAKKIYLLILQKLLEKSI